MALWRNLEEDALETSRKAASFEPTEGTKEIPHNLDGDRRKVIRIGTSLTAKYESALVDFLRAKANIFTWKPSDMPGIPREFAEHSLHIMPGSKPVKQHLRRFDDEKRKAIGEEIAKLLTTGFIKEVREFWIK